MTVRKIARKWPVLKGNPNDPCPICGAWRENAGYIRESCGPGFGKPGCFVVVKKEKPA